MALDAGSVKGVVKGKPGARGLAVIITNDYTSNDKLKNLPGTNKDGESLESALLALNFAVYRENNASGDKLKQIISDMQHLKNKQVRDYRCIFFIFSGHGSVGDCLVMEDGQSLRLNEDIISPLLPKSVKEMGTVPRVFLIDACRGGKVTSTTEVPKAMRSENAASKNFQIRLPEEGDFPIDAGTTTEVPRDNSPANTSMASRIRLPEEGGYLLAYATIPMHMSYDTSSGGRWLSRVARLLKDRVCLNSFQNLLTEVNKKLLEESVHTYQQPEMISRLNKQVNLEPTDMQVQVRKTATSDAILKAVMHPLPLVVKKAFEQFLDVNRSVEVTITNRCALNLTDCRWYTHHGTVAEAVSREVPPEGTSKMVFVKNNIVFFGVSGFIEFTLAKGKTKKKMIVTFSAPIRGKTNIVTVTILDEKERDFIGDGSTTYSHLIQKNIDKLKTRKKKKVESAIFGSSNEGGISTNPCVGDETIQTRVLCTIDGYRRATLDVTVTNL